MIVLTHMSFLHWLQTFFVVLSMSGVGLVAYATTTDPMKENAYIGVICMIGSLICLTLHLVRMMHDERKTGVSFIFHLVTLLLIG